MNQPNTDHDPVERAAESKRLSAEAVEAHRAKQLPTYTPTVIRDLEAREEKEK